MTAAQTFLRADKDSFVAPHDPMDLRRRSAGTRESPVVPAGLYAERVASRLGHVAALAGIEDGSLYAVSRTDGVVYHLSDRAHDGRFETQRPLARDFQTPTGLAVKDGLLYVSDLAAIWRVDLETGVKSEFVSLRNMSAGEARPLLIYEDRLILGISKTPKTSSVISVDLGSGVATHLTDMPEAPIRGLSYGGGQIWAAVGGSLRPVDAGSNTETAKHFPLEAGAAALAVMLPSETAEWPEGWPLAINDYVLAVQGPSSERPSERHSGGNNIAALPTQFGAPSSELSVLVGGFSGRDGKSAWAAPTALWTDARGLFFADRLSGSLWRVSLDDRPAPKPRKAKDPRPVPVQKPSLKPNETQAMSGSLIGEASGMGSASRLKVGSFLKKAHDEKEAAELAAKDAEETKTSADKAKARDARKRQLRGRQND